MPPALRVNQPSDSRLASAENALANIARESEPLPEPGIDKAAPRERARRSAQSGLIKMACFFGLIVSLVFALNAMINSGLHRIGTSEFGVWNKIVQGQISAEIVISGSSRALTHYDPRIIQQTTGRSTFNIGLNGSQTDMQLARLKAYLRHNRKPKLLVQNLDLFSFATSHEIYDPSQYVPYLKEDSIYAGVRRVYPYAWKWKYLPLYGYAVEDMRFNWMIGLKALAGIQPREDQVDGYQPRDTPWTGDFEKYRDANPNGVTVETEAQGVRDFEDLLSLCAQQGVPALIVYSPEYYEMQTLERNRAEIIGKAREIAGRFRVPLWDYSDSPICRNRANFYNSQHLNEKGAVAFSEEFAKRLAEPGNSGPKAVVVGTPAAINTIKPSLFGDPVNLSTPLRKLCPVAATLFSALAFIRGDLIPMDRLTDWSPGTRTGVTGGIPTRTTLIDVTQTPYNADNTDATDASSAIQSALNAASSGQVVYLPAGTYRINSSLSLKSNITLRGAGVGTTILDVQASNGVTVPLDPSWANSYNSISTILSGLTSGSTSIVVTTPGGGLTPFIGGRMAQISWPNDPNKPVISNYGFANVRKFDCLITGRSGSTLTITPPLPATFVNVGTAKIIETQIAPVSYAGLENLTISGNGTSMINGIQLQMAVNSWVQNVKVINQQNYGFEFFDCVFDTITHCWITAGGVGTNHSGMVMNSDTALLVYDNIIEDNQPGFEINQCTTSSVIAYNLVLCSLLGIDSNHGPHNSFNLYEGNITNNFISDGYFGGESETTIFRNWIMAVNAVNNTNSFAIALERFARNFSLVGNIMQSAGHTWTDDSVPLGHPNMGNSSSFGTAQPSTGSWWRDLNSDGSTPYTGTLTTRTDNNHGQITLSSGTGANLVGSNRNDNLIVFQLANGTAPRTFLMSVSGNVLTVDSTNGGVSQLESLPPLNAALNLWAGPGGFQEIDLDVAATLVRRGNYYYHSGNIPSSEALGTDTLPNSLYLGAKPSWFGDLIWPPFDPTAPGTPAYEQIPAGYRYVHGTDPPGSGDGPGAPGNLRIE
jgi:hypothetical protein